MSIHNLRPHHTKITLIALVLLALPIVAACNGTSATATPTAAPEIMATPTSETMDTPAADTESMETPSADTTGTPGTEMMEDTMSGQANTDLTVYADPDAASDGSSSDEVATVSSGDTLTLMGRRMVDSAEWLYVQTANGDEGWVDGSGVTAEADTSALPEQ